MVRQALQAGAVKSQQQPARTRHEQQAPLCVYVLTCAVDPAAAPRAETSHSSFTGANSISLKKIVDMFYDKVLADTALAPFFENINMQKLKTHQVRAPVPADCLQPLC